MSLLNDIKKRQEQRRGKSFIKSIHDKNDVDVKQAFLDNKDIQSNEIVLSYLFFHYPSLISMLPLEFQKTMLNSNLSMFENGSTEAKKALVSDWLTNNKFFMNVKSLSLDNEEYENYICMYFNQVDDVAKLYMDDLYRVIEILSKHDIRMTENIISEIKDKLSDRQWEFVLKANPIFIKYASEDIQKEYATDESFGLYISGEAREIYVKKQLDRLNNNFDLFYDMPIDVQKECIMLNPTYINKLNDEAITNLLKYDIELIKYVDIYLLKNKDFLYSVIENSVNSSLEDIINIYISKCLLNAKGKLYRFDSKSNNIIYQYTKRLIKIMQELSIEKILPLIDIDVNYVLPYIVPLYNEKDDIEIKKSEVYEANSRCLNLFKKYFNEEYYNKYYKIINKIYNEYAADIDKYDYVNDYDCIFELFKIIFNKRIIENNSPEKISVFVGISLLYKGKENNDSNSAYFKLFNELLFNAYKKELNLNIKLYDINSLELFDERLSFISSNLFNEIIKYNHIYLSTLLYVVKNDNLRKLFINYYEIIINIYGENVYALCFALENFTYYKDILNDIDNKDLNDEEMDNLIRLLVSCNNYLNIKKKEELASYDISILKKLVSDLSENNEINIHKNLISIYLFNKPYDFSGNNLILNVSTIQNWCDVVNEDILEELGFTKDEIDLFTMIRLMFETDNNELIVSLLESFMNEKITVNIVPIIDLFNKLEKYKYQIINNQVVSIDDIEMLYENDKTAVSKREEDGVVIYSFNEQDFKVLVSTTNNGYHYAINLISEIDKNSYGYNKFDENLTFNFTTFENKTLLKVDKDKKLTKQMRPNFICVKNDISPELIKVAKENDLVLLCVGDKNE